MDLRSFFCLYHKPKVSFLKVKALIKLREMLKFFSARISTLLIEMACMTLLVNILHWNDRISKFAVQFIVMALNYIFSKLFVFRIKE